MFQFSRLSLSLLLVVTSALFTYIIQNIIITDDILASHLGAQLSYDRVEKMLNLRKDWAWVNYAALPFVYLIKFTLTSLWILCGIILFGYKAELKRIFHAVIVAEFVWIIPTLITTIWFGFIHTNYTVEEIQFFQPLSLLNLFDAASLDPWLVVPLKALNLFEILYMVILAIGIKRIINKNYNDSLAFTIPVYGTGLVTWIVFMTFLTINLSV